MRMSVCACDKVLFTSYLSCPVGFLKQPSEKCKRVFYQDRQISGGIVCENADIV